MPPLFSQVFLEFSSKPVDTGARPLFGKLEPRSSPNNQAPRGEGPEAQEAHLCHGKVAQLISQWENKQDYGVNGLHVVTRQDRGSGSTGHGMPPKTVQAPKSPQIQNPRLPGPPLVSRPTSPKPQTSRTKTTVTPCSHRTPRPSTGNSSCDPGNREGSPKPTKTLSKPVLSRSQVDLSPRKSVSASALPTTES